MMTCNVMRGEKEQTKNEGEKTNEPKNNKKRRHQQRGKLAPLLKKLLVRIMQPGIVRFQHNINFRFMKEGKKRHPCVDLLSFQLHWHPAEVPSQERVPAAQVSRAPYLGRTINSIHVRCSPSICLLPPVTKAQECLLAETIKAATGATRLCICV